MHIYLFPYVRKFFGVLKRLHVSLSSEDWGRAQLQILMSAVVVVLLCK